MKTNRRIIIFTLFASLMMIFGLGTVYAVEPITVSIENNPGSINVGSFAALRPKFSPSNSSSDITWSSSDPSIASVDKSGNVKGIKEGTVKITVTTKNKKTSSVTIKVVDSKGTDSKKVSTNFKIVKAPKFLFVGTVDDMRVSGGKKIKWSSSNSDVLSVDNAGNLTAKKIGSATITAKSNSGDTVSAKIHVISVKFKQQNFKFQESLSSNIMVELESSNDFNPILYSKINWNLSDSSLAKVKQTDIKYVLNKQYSKNEYRNIYTYIARATGKKTGKGLLYFNIDGKSIRTNFEVLQYGQDYSIECPTITYTMNDKSKIILLDITPSKNTKYYTVDNSVNKKTGKNAQWSNNSQRFSGRKQFKYSYGSAQVRLTIFDTNGKSRFCYSAPFDVYNTKISNQISTSFDNSIKCPNLKEKVQYIKGFNSSNSAYARLNDDNYNDEKNTGIANVQFTGSINPKSNSYQYSWYDINNKDDKYFWDLRLKGTYSTTKNFNLSTSNHENTGALLAMNNKGDVRLCKTDNYSSSKYELIDTLGKTKVLKVNGESCSDYNQTKNILREVYKNARYMFESGGSFVKYIVITHDGAWTSWNGPVVSLPCDNPDIWLAPVHELAHAWDMMNNITGSENGTTEKKTEYANLMKKYHESTTLGSKNLRTDGANIQDPSGCFYKYSWYYNQSYGPTMEFFVGLYSHYYLTKFHSKNEYDNMGMHACWRWLLKNSSIPSDVNNYISKTVKQYNK